ncbi:MAG TPA: uridine kinase [Candidatus Bipolaricaulota bacterium]
MDKTSARHVFFIGLAGGTGSGKTTIARAVTEGIPDDWVTIVPLDSYYRDLQNLPLEQRAGINYDHPDAFEWDLLLEHLDQLHRGQKVGMPIYSFAQHKRLEERVQIKPRPIIIVEGILALYSEALRRRYDLKVYVDAEADERILRRIERDIQERGRSLKSVIQQYRETVKPMHQAFVEPTKAYADIIIPEGMNKVAVDLVRAKIERVVHLGRMQAA